MTSQQKNKTDYCGSRKSKLISWLIPDEPFGVDISECCKNHDESWMKEGANKSGDKSLRHEIEDKFYIAGKPAWLGYSVAWWYYIGVRFGGVFYKIAGH